MNSQFEFAFEKERKGEDPEEETHSLRLLHFGPNAFLEIRDRCMDGCGCGCGYSTVVVRTAVV